MEQWALMSKTECRESIIEKIADYRQRNRRVQMFSPFKIGKHSSRPGNRPGF
jgi:hypothetical protein